MNPGAVAPGTALVPVVVLVAAALHAIWNAVAHGMKDQLAGFALINLANGGCSAVLIVFAPRPNAAAWPFLLASAAIHVGYQLLLLRSYRLGDFAQMYPIARGTSPLLGAIWSTPVLAQLSTTGELTGVLIICTGLIGLALPGGLPGRRQLPALAAAIATGAAIASYTVVDGLGVRHSTTVLGYIAWLFLLQSPILIGYALIVRRPAVFAELPARVWLSGLAGGVLSLIAYGLALWAQARGSLATIAALRETSIVVAALIGALFFHERLGLRRTVASVVVVIGIAVLELTSS